MAIKDSFIVVDIETTGVDSFRHSIASIGAIDSKSGDYFYQECKINDDRLIDVNALAVNGFTVDELRDENKLTDVEMYRLFLEWASPRSNLLAGHNIGSFDVQFLKEVNSRARTCWQFGHKYIDLHSMAFLVFGESLSHEKIALKLSLDPEEKPHNALSGAKSELNCINELFQMLNC